jgi:hypothetical protein
MQLFPSGLGKNFQSGSTIGAKERRNKSGQLNNSMAWNLQPTNRQWAALIASPKGKCCE